MAVSSEDRAHDPRHPIGEAWRESWIGGARRKLGSLFPRVAPAEVTERLARACMPRIPVTRLADLTQLDRLSLPVFAAVTPLAADLTTHLGKGSSPRNAALSALMEAVERWSAETTSQPRLAASYAELSSRNVACVDPSHYDLPDDTKYAPDRVIDWVQGFELFSERPVWIPCDLVISPPSGQVLRRVDTNGLASGNTLLEAIVHGLAEVIERDAMSQVVFQSLFGRADGAAAQLHSIDARDLPQSLRRLFERLSDNDIEVELAQVVSDVRVPTFRCVLRDPQFPTLTGTEPHAFFGCGTAPFAELAALRAINEAVQSRLAIVQGARDSFNWIPLDSHQSRSATLRSFAEVPSQDSLDLEDDLEFMRSALRAAGIAQGVVIDLTRRDSDIPVVRIRVAHLSGFLVNRQRTGWRVLRQLV